MTECFDSAEDCPAARGAAKAAVKEVFALLGVDVESPAEVEDFRKSLRFGETMRKAADKGFIVFVGAVVLLIFGALVAGVKVKIGG